MPYTEQQDAEKAFRVIQDIAVMLTGASEYVCEKRMLTRYSSGIETSLDMLESRLSELKRGFPGKLPEALNPDTLLTKLRQIASSLKADDSGIEAECRAGTLGEELFRCLKEFKAALRDISNALDGKPISPYSVTDKLFEMGARFKPFFAGISALLSSIGKILTVVVIVLILSFVYLYVTMESEDTLVAGINDVFASIQTRKDTLAKQRKEYEQITAAMNRLREKELARDEKIQLLDLSTERQKMEEHIAQGVLLLEKSEEELADKKKSLGEFQKKTFLQKLFKR